MRVLSFLEKKYIKFHLMRTEYWMRTKDTSHLGSNQKQNRIRVLQILNKYWKNEEFPINSTHKQKIPQIKDKTGTMCALAYIMHNSGESFLVEDLAQNNNYVLVNDVPDDHHLIDVITNKGISKKEAAKIQPSYSCHAMVGGNTGDPVVELLGIILSIVGVAIALSFYGVLNHVSYNIDKKTVRIVIILGIVVAGGGFGMTYQKSVAEPFSDVDFIGDYHTTSIVDDLSIHYWIDGGKVKHEYNAGIYFLLIPNRDGQIVVAYPPIMVKGYGDDYYDNYYENPSVFLNGKEIEPTQYKLNGYHILKIPFSKDDSTVEITYGGMCDGFIFD